MKLYKGPSGQLTSEVDLRATFDTHRKEDDEFARQYAKHEFSQFLKDNGFVFYGYHQLPDNRKYNQSKKVEQLMKLNNELRKQIEILQKEVKEWEGKATQYQVDFIRMKKLVQI